MLRLALALILLAPGAAAQAAYDVTVPFDSEDAEARAAFERGVELLHSFEYDDARDAFREAQAADPEGLMPFWGEAMTHNHPVWQRQDAMAGLDVLGRLDARMAATGIGVADAGISARSSYLDAVRILFGDGDPDSKEARDDAYLAHMAQFAALYTRDRDALAFHALALLGSAHEGRDYAIYGQAAEVAQSVLDQDPEHPGALHYLIHAYDDPDHAELALPAARAYSEIASAASHALHMPTHIYFAMGLWDEASALNVRAFEAARDASARRGEPLNNHGWHALYWLAYSELQRDSLDSAIEVYQRARALYAADSSRLALAHLVRIRAHLATEASFRGVSGPDTYIGAWEDLPRDQMSTSTLATDLVAATVSYPADDLRAAEASRLALELDTTDASAAVRAMVLFASVAAAQSGREAVGTLFEAMTIIDASPIDFGPPSPPMFPHEALAIAYNEADRPEVARCLTDRVLARAPGRRITGLIQRIVEQDDHSGHSHDDASGSRLAFTLPDVPGCDG